MIMLFGSVFLGEAVAQENYQLIVNILFAVIVVLYLLKFYQYSFLIFVLISISGVVVSLPIGNLPGGLLGMGFFTVAALYTLLRHGNQNLLPSVWRGGLLSALAVMAVFGCLYLFQLANPISPHEFSSRQTLRALAAAVGPALVLGYWCVNRNSPLFRVGSLSGLLLVMGVVTGIHLAYRVYLMSKGYLGAELDLSETAAPVSYRLIGPVSMSPFALRSLGPLAVFTAAFIAFKPSKPRMADNETTDYPIDPWSKKVAWVLLVLGLIGALLSSGRAAVLLSGVGLVMALFYHKRAVPLMGLSVLGLLMVVVINIFSTQLAERLPFSVNRSVSILLVSSHIGSDKASQSISSSTNWRKELAGLAYDEWVSDASIFIRGRGVYAFTASDEMASGYYGVMKSSLKTAAAHVRWLELALTFGLLGIMASYFLHLNLCVRTCAIMRCYGSVLPPLFAPWTFLLCISLPLSLISTASMSPLVITGILASSYQMPRNNEVNGMTL